jgi:phage baseplate assembly protein W
MINLNGTTVTGAPSDISETIKNIITTPKGTVALDRNFGVDSNILDQPVNLIEGLLMVEIIRQIKLYEPRVSVIEVTFSMDENNNLIPKVSVES